MVTSEAGANLEEISGHGDSWRFVTGQHMANVCGKLPLNSDFQTQETWDVMDPMLHADLDALIELYGHLRQVKPHIRRATGLGRQELRELIADDYTSHLVLLRGVDWAAVTAALLGRHEVGLGLRHPTQGDDSINDAGTSTTNERVLGRSVRLAPSAATRPRTVRLWDMARDYVQAFVLRLIALRRRVEPARFARMLELQLRTGRLWAAFRPARPPGQLMMACGHVTRGPDGTRMNQALVIRGELLVLM